MTDTFLKAKHWQLFLLTFGIPMLSQLVMMGAFISNFTSDSAPDPMIIFTYVKFLPFVGIIFMGVFFGWFWSIAIGLQKKLPEHITMNVTRFKIFFIIPIVYILLVFTFMTAIFTSMMEIGIELNGGLVPGSLALIFPLHLFSMFCIFYSMYFVAKTIKTVELQREVSFSDFAGEFFLIWFYPIGIWIIQPKINKMIEEEVLF